MWQSEFRGRDRKLYVGCANMEQTEQSTNSRGKYTVKETDTESKCKCKLYFFQGDLLVFPLMQYSSIPDQVIHSRIQINEKCYLKIKFHVGSLGGVTILQFLEKILTCLWELQERVQRCWRMDQKLVWCKYWLFGVLFLSILSLIIWTEQ